MKNEIQFLKVVPKIYTVPLSDFNYFVFDDNESKNVVKNAFTDSVPNIIYSTTEQGNGNDFRYKGLSLDLKVNGKRYDRPFFELYNKNGKYTYGKAADSHIIVSIMAKDSMIYSFPASLIEMIVNRNIQDLPLPQDFYHTNKYFYQFDDMETLKAKGKTGFAINPDILQSCIRYYLSYYCSNSDMCYLLMQCSPYKDSNNTYIETN